jgi:hypothetical protein
LVGAPIRAVSQKLVEEISIRRVEINPIEASFEG